MDSRILDKKGRKVVFIERELIFLLSYKSSDMNLGFPKELDVFTDIYDMFI